MKPKPTREAPAPPPPQQTPPPERLISDADWATVEAGFNRFDLDCPPRTSRRTTT